LQSGHDSDRAGPIFVCDGVGSGRAAELFSMRRIASMRSFGMRLRAIGQPRCAGPTRWPDGDRGWTVFRVTNSEPDNSPFSR
jgi:hypothetical protein